MATDSAQALQLLPSRLPASERHRSAYGHPEPTGRPFAGLDIAADVRFCCLLLGTLGLLVSLTGLTRCSLCLQVRFGLANTLQSGGAALQFLRQHVTSLTLAILAVLLGVDQLDLAQKRPHLTLQLQLGLEHPHVAHRLVFAGVGPEFGAIQCHMAQAHQSRLLADLENLDKQSR